MVDMLSNIKNGFKPINIALMAANINASNNKIDIFNFTHPLFIQSLVI